MASVLEFLRKVPLFAELPQSDLVRICEVSEELRLGPGQTLFQEGEPGVAAYVIHSGELEVVKASSDGREVLLAVRHPGDVIGEMSLLEESPRMASVRARTEAVVIGISQAQLELLLERSPSAAGALLHTVVGRLRATESHLRQNEKMAQLGTMAAGLAHELNNPAAAVQRGAQQLAETDGLRMQAEAQLDALRATDAERQFLTARVSALRARTPDAGALDALARSDRETELEDWLAEGGADDGWQLAPLLVASGFSAGDRAELAAAVSAERLIASARYLARQVAFLALLDEVQAGATQISALVRALKGYTYLDQAPVQDVDVHEGLENTLIILRAKLKKGVRIKRELAPDLPRISAYGSELNQVWTNLIDNAVDAMNGDGEIAIRTSSPDGGRTVEVEIIDSGPGIPEAIRERIFDPFFTTKPPGKGTGLGLDISYNIVVNRHRGAISVSSRPGRTSFIVRLPVAPATAASAAGAVSRAVGGAIRPADQALRGILESARTIAVVGASTRRESPAHTVPAELQAHGYRVIPVNPRADEILGEKAYPDLLAVPETPEVVLLFRRDGVGAVVEAAIARGARALWMQEGIIDQAAAARAREAGLEVVMDTCMAKTYARLMGDRG